MLTIGQALFYKPCIYINTFNPYNFRVDSIVPKIRELRHREVRFSCPVPHKKHPRIGTEAIWHQNPL